MASQSYNYPLIIVLEIDLQQISFPPFLGFFRRKDNMPEQNGLDSSHQKGFPIPLKK